MAASNGLAYWVGFQRATAHLRGRPEAVPFNLRVTELYRREDGTWKLIHRHVDQVLSEPEANQQ
jgi:ketosteroid isomerase-like protein